MTPYAYEPGDRVAIGDTDLLIVGFRKLLGKPVEYCLRAFSGVEFVDTWMTVPEINAWRGLEESSSV